MQNEDIRRVASQLLQSPPSLAGYAADALFLSGDRRHGNVSALRAHCATFSNGRFFERKEAGAGGRAALVRFLYMAIPCLNMKRTCLVVRCVGRFGDLSRLQNYDDLQNTIAKFR